MRTSARFSFFVFSLSLFNSRLKSRYTKPAKFANYFFKCLDFAMLWRTEQKQVRLNTTTSLPSKTAWTPLPKFIEIYIRSGSESSWSTDHNVLSLDTERLASSSNIRNVKGWQPWVDRQEVLDSLVHNAGTSRSHTTHYNFGSSDWFVDNTGSVHGDLLLVLRPSCLELCFRHVTLECNVL